MDSSTIVSFSVDTTSPIIKISSPTNAIYNVPNVFLDFVVDEQTSWIGYSLDGQNNQTISGPTSISLSEGSHELVVYANDTSGNMGKSSVVSFIIQFPPQDTTPPIITVISPEVKTYSTLEINLNFIVSEQVSLISYSLDGQNRTITGNTTLSIPNEGQYTITVYATDNAGNMGSSDPIQFEIKISPEQDTKAPIVTVKSPRNLTYFTDSISLEFSVSEDPYLMYYSLNGGANITIFDSIVFSDLAEGEHKLILYAEDAMGNIGASELINFAISQNEDISSFIGVVIFLGGLLTFVGVSWIYVFLKEMQMKRLTQ